MKILTSIMISLFASGICYSQCSDAGVCFPGSHLTDQNGDNSFAAFNYTNAGSGSPDDIKYNLFELGGSIAIYKELSLAFSIPYLIQKSDTNILAYSYGVLFEKNVTYSGLGDMIALLDFNVMKNKTSSLNIQLGGKFKTAAKKFKYFNGYGTNDILAGVQYHYKQFVFGTSAQIPLGEYSDDQIEFKRGADISVRAGYSGNSGSFGYNGELLAIKRLSKNELNNKGPILAIYTNPYEFPESDFFQINVIGGFSYNLNRNFQTEINFALPLLKRDDNSDGTKRAYTIDAGLIYNFNL